MSEPSSEHAVDPIQAAPPRAPLPVWVLPVVTGVVGLVVGLVVGGVAVGAAGAAQHDAEAAAATDAAEAAKSTVFKDAVRGCGANQSYAVVGDEGRSLTIEHEGEEDYAGLSSTELWCIVEALDAPASVIAHMEQTTSMDGRQTESWDDIEISWSYHPDRGMDSVLTLTD